MSHRCSSPRRWRHLGPLVLLFLFGHGCRSSNKSVSIQSDAAKSPVPLDAAEEAFARDPARTSASAPVKAKEESSQVFRGLSDEEIKQLYRSASRSNKVPVSPASQAPSNHPAAVEMGSVPASWKVDLEREWRYIVVHHSFTERGSAAIFDTFHKSKGWDGLGYHFVIGNGTDSGDGQVEVGFRWQQQKTGAHARTPDQEYNQSGIGVCLVGNFDAEEPTPKQMASLRRLVGFLAAYARIAPARIMGHREVPGTDKTCPGTGFDMDAFKRSLGGAAETIPAEADVVSRPVPGFTYGRVIEINE